MAFEVLLLDDTHGCRLYGLRKDEYFDRSQLYTVGERDYDDNAERFTFFSRAVLRAVEKLDLAPEVVHAHDWQAALLPALLAARAPPRPRPC